MRMIFCLAALAALASCVATPDVDYCKRYGEREGTPEFGKCLDYYHQQEAMFERDLAVCNEKADLTYPRALYDDGSRRTARVYGGAGWGRADWDGPETVWIDTEPDEQHNALVDGLRYQIVLPCMNQKGWQSAQSWELGRIEPNKRHR